LKLIKILVFGKYDVFTLSLISRLYKEDYKVFVVTGNAKKDRAKPIEVFQEYNFTYDSESILYILRSIEAEIVIFSGALDSCFDLKNKPNEASKFIAGITNVMIHCKNTNIKQFLYISSCSVFSGNAEGIVTEEIEPIPISNRDKAILMGEKICTSYHKDVNFDVTIVRVAEIYGKYKNEVLEENICTSICKEMVQDGKVTVHYNLLHNLVYVDDVIECIYRIIKAPVDENTIYNIAPQDSTAYLEEQLVELLEDISGKKIEIDVREYKEESRSHIYQSENIKKLGFSEKYDIKKGLKNVYTVIEQQLPKVSKKDERILSLISDMFRVSEKSKNRLLPLIENTLFFLLIQCFVVFTMNFHFHQVVDVYLLYVILVALIYGYMHSALAVLLSIVGKLYIALLYNSQFTAVDDYGIYLWILQIFSIGVLVGYLKDKYKRKFRDVNDEKDQLQLELANIKDINRGNIEIRSLYEKRLLNYKDSFARIYDIVSQLDAIEPERVIFKSINVIAGIMETHDVAIYTCDKNSQFCRLMAASSINAKKMKKSIKISSYEDIYAKLNRQEIYVNKTLNPNYPAMVGGTYKDGALQTIIMILSLPFENNNLYEVNIFGVLCKLVEKTMDRAFMYLENVNKSYNRKYEGIMDAEAFEKLLQLYMYGEKEKLVDFSLLKVESYMDMNEETFFTLLRQKVRDTDYIGINSNNETYILVTNSNMEEANFVIDRLSKSQIYCRIWW
jgi:nucleoside-diphosphate-sugar epimerase